MKVRKCQILIEKRKQPGKTIRQKKVLKTMAECSIKEIVKLFAANFLSSPFLSLSLSFPLRRNSILEQLYTVKKLPVFHLALNWGVIVRYDDEW